MFSSTATLSAFASLLSLSSVHTHSGGDALIKQNFKEDASGWTAMGSAAKVSVSHEAPIAPVGLGALQFDYKIEKGETDALVLPTEAGSLAKAKSIKFKVMSDGDTPIAVFLQEKDGGRYVAFCSAKKNAWQDCELAASDFILAQETQDPKDPDGKLDFDQIGQIGILDLGGIVGAGGNADIAKLLHVQNGNHRIFIERFSVETDPISPAFSKTEGTASLDNFAHPQLSWFGIGDVKLSVESDTPLDGKALMWIYKQEAQQFVGANLAISPGLLTGCKTLSFDLSSIAGGTFKLQLESVGGNKFNTSIDLPSGGKPKHIVLNFSDFACSEDSAVPNATLDLSKVKTLLLADLSGSLAQFNPDHPENTLYINHIVAK